MFENLFRKKTDKVLFDAVEYCGSNKLENQNGVIENASLQDLERLLQLMLDDPNQFLILTAGNPSYGVSYVQAARIKNNIIDVELGLERDGKSELVQKNCTEEECRAIMTEFFNSTYVEDMDSYKPMQFFC